MPAFDPDENSAAMFMALYAVVAAAIDQGALDKERLRQGLEVSLNSMPEDRQNGPFGFYLKKLVQYLASDEPLAGLLLN